MTEPQRWADAGSVTVTRSVSYSSRSEIRRRVERGFDGFHFSDQRVEGDQVLTVVEVSGRLARPTQRIVKLRTLFELPGGSRVVKRWQAPTAARVWQAAFALPSAPRTAVTEVVQ